MDNFSAGGGIPSTVLAMQPTERVPTERVPTERVIVVEGFAPIDPGSPENLNLRTDVMSVALDQRVFGPRKLLVYFTTADGWMLSVAITDRVEPIDDAFQACLIHLGGGATAAVAYLDEPVGSGPASKQSVERFARLQQVAASHGITLVDWISCDDDTYRSARLSDPLSPDEEWWAVAGGGC